MPNNISINLHFLFCFILIVSLAFFFDNPDSSRDLTIFKISFIFSLETIVVKPNPNNFLGIATSVADAPSVSPNGIKTLLANGLSKFPIKGNPFFIYGAKSLPRNLLDCPISYN